MKARTPLAVAFPRPAGEPPLFVGVMIAAWIPFAALALALVLP